MQEHNRRVTIIIASIVGFVLIVLVAVGFYVNSLTDANKESIKINNFNAVVKNLPSSEKDIIESTLYSTVAFNVSDEQAIKNIDDAVIRTESYVQELNNKVYTTSFIVDIESIKQSYEIRDLYSNLDREESGLYDYTTLALCVSKDKLKFGEFTCQDRISQETGVTESDPILQYLPESTLEYTLSLDSTSKDLHLIAELSLSEIDYKLGAETAVNQYKAKLQQWFESKNLDINNYSITYKY